MFSANMLICLFNSIHPEDKQDVAYRLVLGARAVAYGEKNVSFQGPFATRAMLNQDFISIVFDQGINAIPDDGFFFEVSLPSNISTYS